MDDLIKAAIKLKELELTLLSEKQESKEGDMIVNTPNEFAEEELEGLISSRIAEGYEIDD